MLGKQIVELTLTVSLLPVTLVLHHLLSNQPKIISYVLPSSSVCKMEWLLHSLLFHHGQKWQ